MLMLSDVLIQNPDLESFNELIPLIQERAKAGEMYFKIDVKPSYFDTPEDWEDRLEAAFSGLIR
ncbi:MAG: sulfur relay protein DsrC [Chromatiales bacterium]|nr:sulfur relay protein DsrC [Chromatiales bacterium]